ncbi:DUF58 domain-containing protein [Virgibacillus halodenitrificans]|uniref:DUF58 domain-containing protein n=1 Tax=Virgibacillus halodenitrificans TaxID=1482 RepID=UPI00045C9FA2|nr:DUF58 domain-containing protein [Virgibacillus halodenitrificans]CDQ36826.1 hypothetical protein BN993_06342 [Virgibacillus halodenitrificans]
MKKKLRSIGNFVFIIALFLVLFSYAMFQGGFVSWFLFFSFQPIFLNHVGLLLYPIKGWKVTRTVSRYMAQAGSDVTITVNIKRAFPFPLYYCICEDVFSDTLGLIDNRQNKYQHFNDSEKLKVNREMKKVIFPSFKRTFSFSYNLKDVPRGEHVFYGIRIRTGDVFGFVKKDHMYSVRDQLLVYPNERPIELKEQVSSYEQGSTSSSFLHLQQTNIAAGIREYMPGDKFSWIDWKQSARTNTLMTKEFEQEKSSELLLVLDACEHGNMNYLAFEAAVELSYSLVKVFQQRATPAELITIGRKSKSFSLQSEITANESVRQHLTKIQPSGDAEFTSSFSEMLLHLKNKSSLIIITVNLDHLISDKVKKWRQQTPNISIILIKSTVEITTMLKKQIQQLELFGINVEVLTEKELVNNPVEVSL